MILALIGFAPLAHAANGAPSLEFNRDVRPILSDKCFACHGPDAKNKAERVLPVLRLLQ